MAEEVQESVSRRTVRYTGEDECPGRRHRSPAARRKNVEHRGEHRRDHPKVVSLERQSFSTDRGI